MPVRFQAKRWNCISVSWSQEVAHHNWDQASVLVGSESPNWVPDCPCGNAWRCFYFKNAGSFFVLLKEGSHGKALLWHIALFQEEEHEIYLRHCELVDGGWFSE